MRAAVRRQPITDQARGATNRQPTTRREASAVMDELRTLYSYRQLIAALTARDLKARYRGSILGFFWSLANPLLLLTVYTVVFTFFFPSNLIHPYPLFLFSGILPWRLFSAPVLESTSSISSNAGLIKK